MRIVFIMVDTLRYDCLKQGGAKLPYTPELDKFAEGASFCTQQYLSSFPTVPNREDIMLGKYSFPHHGWGPLPTNRLSMAELFRDAGYLTQLITDTPHLLGTGHGYHRGFQGYNWIRGNECDTAMTRYNHPLPNVMPPEKTRVNSWLFGHPLCDLQTWLNPDMTWEERFFAPRTAQTVSQWIEDNYKAKDFFLWVDMFEVHEPWLPPKYLQERYDPGYKGEPMCYPTYGGSEVYSPAELRNMRALYDGEVTLTSKWIGHILRKLEDVGIYDDTMIALVSDHGTYIGEYKRAGKFLLGRERGAKTIPWPQYDEVNRIPMIVKAPRQKKGAVIRELIQPVDYLPTLLDMAGVKSDLAFDGFSMKGLLEGKKAPWPRKQAYSSNSIRDRYPNFWTTVSTPRWQLNVGGTEEDKPILVDRQTDPKQSKNVAPKNRERVNAMIREYLRFLERCGTAPGKIERMREKIVKG